VVDRLRSECPQTCGLQCQKPFKSLKLSALESVATFRYTKCQHTGDEKSYPMNVFLLRHSSHTFLKQHHYVKDSYPVSTSRNDARATWALPEYFLNPVRLRLLFKADLLSAEQTGQLLASNVSLIVCSILIPNSKVAT